MRKLVKGDMRKLVESDMRSARMKKVTKVMCEKKEQETTAIKGNTDFWKAVRVIFTCFTRFSGSKVLEVDLSACTFLQCQSGGKETRCRLCTFCRIRLWKDNCTNNFHPCAVQGRQD